MDQISKIIDVPHQHPDVMPAVMRHIPRRLVSIAVNRTHCKTYATLEMYPW